jgi:ribose transport system permease protein
MITVGTQTVIVALAALGMTMIIISAGIDLSVGSAIALSSVVAALMIRSGHSAVWALLAGAAVGMLVGAINGSLITGLKVTPFIVTLGMLGVARGMARWLAKEQVVLGRPTWLDPLLGPKAHGFLGLPNGIWAALALAVLTAIMLKFTVFGRRIFAIGSNETASRLSGLRVDALKIAIYAIAGVFVGLAGVLQYARLGEGDPSVAEGRELDVIAAVVIGGGSLMGGEGSILGSIVGALIMAFLINGFQIMGVPDYMQRIVIGIVIVAAVALDGLRRRSEGAT